LECAGKPEATDLVLIYIIKRKLYTDVTSPRLCSTSALASTSQPATCPDTKHLATRFWGQTGDNQTLQKVEVLPKAIRRHTQSIFLPAALHYPTALYFFFAERLL